MNLFNSLVNVEVRDCILNGRVLFIVEQGKLGKAVGKKGVNVKNLEKLINKKVKVVEFSDDVCKFIKNLIYPVKVADVFLEGNVVNIKVDGVKEKAILIGRNRKNLKEFVSIVRRYFNIDGVRVI